MRPFPVADDQVEAAVAVGVERRDAARVLLRVAYADQPANLAEGAIAVVAEQVVRPALVADENIHPLGHQRHRQHASSPGHQRQPRFRRDVFELAVLVQLVQAHRPAVVGDEEAVQAAAKPVDAGHRAAGRQVEHRLAHVQRKQVGPLVVHAVEQPVGQPLVAGEGVGVEDVDFFLAVTVYVAGGDADRLPVAVGQNVRRDVAKALSVPLEAQIRRIGEAGNKQLERAVAVEVGHGDAIVELHRVIE